MALGTFGEELSEGSRRETGLIAHVWTGLIVLLLVAVRIPWRVANPPPKSSPTEFGKWLIEWTDPAARIMHYLLYVLLVAVPLVGIAFSSREDIRSRCLASWKSRHRGVPTERSHGN
ncbi:cytochrome b [Bradyrhizobium elkanii]|uniref:cytochrome b n=1 Tax=Bradyrhizobium elkanii TaxID=29448 RepID=UPI0034E522D9